MEFEARRAEEILRLVPALPGVSTVSATVPGYEVDGWVGAARLRLDEAAIEAIADQLAKAPSCRRIVFETGRMAPILFTG